jgi:23S rRNA (pseudouridine1915-N3)-methyltransferase
LLKVRIVAIGKDKDTWVSEGCSHYSKLLSRYAAVEIKIIPALKSSAGLSPSQIKAQEAERFDRVKPRGILIALSDRGLKMDSMRLAREIEKIQSRTGEITFYIGGAHGLHERLLKQADMVLSLSPLTFSHRLVRLILLEQLYRALSILHGSPYHK